jgi:hypothetical protein
MTGHIGDAEQFFPKSTMWLFLGSAGETPNAAYFLLSAPKAPWSAVACYRF